MKRYPGWFAYQTVAQTFYDRSQFRKPPFEIAASPSSTVCRAYEHTFRDGKSELLIMLWNDGEELKTSLHIAGNSYRCPVRVKSTDYRDWTDLPYDVDAQGQVTIPLTVRDEPTIVRLFHR